MRIWLQARPPRAARAHAPPTSIRAVNEQNAQFAAGKIGQAPIEQGQELVYTVTTRGPPRRAAASSRTSSCAPTPTARRVRLNDVARVELGAQDYDFIGRIQRQAGDADRHLPAAGRQRARRSAKACEATAGRARRSAFPTGLTYIDSLRHHALRRGLDPRGHEDARRGDAARLPGRLPVPAELARDADPARRRAGVADRHVRRHVRARLFDQHADALRPGARDRHRRRRRDRRAGERRAHHARGEGRRRARRRSRRCTRSPARSSRSC